MQENSKRYVTPSTSQPSAVAVGQSAVGFPAVPPLLFKSYHPSPFQLKEDANTIPQTVPANQEREVPQQAWHTMQQRLIPSQTIAQLKTGEEILNDNMSLEEDVDNTLPDTKTNVVQRHIIVGNSKTPTAAIRVRSVLAAVRSYWLSKSVKGIGKGVRKHPLFMALTRQNFAGRAKAVTKIIKSWLADKVVDGRRFSTWDEVAVTASRQQLINAAIAGRTPEEMQNRKRKFEAMKMVISSDSAGKVKDSEPGTEEEKGLRLMLPELRREASFATDLISNDVDNGNTFLPVRRRKMNRAGTGDLPGYEIRYRTYEGTISPKANNFILGGSLPTDYAPLMDDLIKLIAGEVTSKEKDVDKVIANLFLKEMSGVDAFADFSALVKEYAHKIIAIILFAEFSRSSIALVSAAAAFHAVASRPEGAAEPGLHDSFATGSGKERPLFAGKGGPEIMRSETLTIEEVTEKEIMTRRARGVVDLLNYLNHEKTAGEEVMDVIRRKTLEMQFALARHTDEHSMKVAWMVQSLFALLGKVLMPKKLGDSSLVTLAALGFGHHAQPGDENNCAIYSLYHQLTIRHGLAIPDQAGFINHVRARVGGPMGSMIDLVAQGQAMIAAAQDYMTNVIHLPAVNLSLNVWASTGDGGLMEFNNVASAGAGGLACVLYYNGVNHFDSLTGGAL